MCLTFTVQLNRNGIMRCKATVSAIEAGLVGDWFEGKPYQPHEAETVAALPYHYRKAFKRALKWWQQDSMSGRLMPLKADLTSTRGNPMGTVWATPDWVA